MTKRITVGDQTYMFQIWDTAGQEKVGQSIVSLTILLRHQLLSVCRKK